MGEAITLTQLKTTLERLQDTAVFSHTEQELTEAQQAQARSNIGAVSADDLPDTPVKGTDYWTDEDKEEIVEEVTSDETLIDTIAEIVKAEVPLVKVAEQPTFVDSIDEMTDTSKVYVMSDGYFYAYQTALPHALEEDDYTTSDLNTNGSLVTTANYGSRFVTVELLSLVDNLISVTCPSPYQYIIYFYTSDSTDSYIGKTSFKAGNIDDVTQDTIASGTMSGATHCRISFRDGNDTGGSLTDRFDELFTNVSVTQKSLTGKEWTNTGFAYNQPADYEDRITALENALEGLEYGTY